MTCRSGFAWKLVVDILLWMVWGNKKGKSWLHCSSNKPQQRAAKGFLGNWSNYCGNSYCTEAGCMCVWLCVVFPGWALRGCEGWNLTGQRSLTRLTPWWPPHPQAHAVECMLRYHNPPPPPPLHAQRSMHLRKKAFKKAFLWMICALWSDTFLIPFILF